MFRVTKASIPKSPAPVGPEDNSSEDDDGGYDGAESVASADKSETNSLGSLTSVD